MVTTSHITVTLEYSRGSHIAARRLRPERKATEGELAGGVLSDDRQTGNFFLLSFHDCSLLLEAIARKTVEVNNSDDLLVRKLWFLS